MARIQEKHRLWLIKDSKSSRHWQSCGDMIEATTEALLHAFSPEVVKIFALEELQQATQTYRWVQEMQAERRLHGDPARIVLFDQTLNFSRLLKALLLVFDGKPPPCVFFTYGSFAKNMKRWYDAGQELTQFRMVFVAPSKAQAQVLQGLLVSAQIEICTPPTHDGFAFQAKARHDLRERLGIGPQEPVLIYSGRIAMEKNVPLLVREFLEWRKASARPAHLLIAGPMDDADGGLVRDLSTLGYQYQALNQELRAHKSVHDLGPLSAVEINDALAAADAFVSLSLFHQEAFGLAAAEATASGLPLILTDWGGFRSFVDLNPNCELIPVGWVDQEYVLNKGRLLTAFDRVRVLPIAEREKLAALGRARFSALNTAARLRFLFMAEPKPFVGFTDQARQWADLAELAKIDRILRSQYWRSFQASKSALAAIHFSNP